MDDTQLDWLGAVPVLLAVARTGSATTAAAQLGTSPATALRRLTQLEGVLGARLFDRTPTGMLPTAALDRALPWAEQVEAAAQGMQRELLGLEVLPVGTVRVALLPALSSWFVAPRLPALLRQHPGLVIELVPARAVMDLVRREADIAVRSVRPDTGDLVTQRLATVRLAVVAAPALLAETRPGDLHALPWLDWDVSMAHQPESTWLARAVPNARVVLRSTELETLLRAAIAGVGALVIGEPLAAVAGGLVHVDLPMPPLPEGSLWLVAHRALRPVPRVAAVWDWLVQGFQNANGAYTLAQRP